MKRIFEIIKLVNHKPGGYYRKFDKKGKDCW